MSPPGQGLSTIPPPPKRHQVGPPGQPDAVNPAQSRPAEQRAVPPVTTSSEPQPYSFYRNINSPYNRPYHSASYSTTPSGTSPVTSANGLNHSSQPPPDRSSLNPLAHPGSPHSRPPRVLILRPLQPQLRTLLHAFFHRAMIQDPADYDFIRICLGQCPHKYWVCRNQPPQRRHSPNSARWPCPAFAGPGPQDPNATHWQQWH